MVMSWYLICCTRSVMKIRILWKHILKVCLCLSITLTPVVEIWAQGGSESPSPLIEGTGGYEDIKTGIGERAELEGKMVPKGVHGKYKFHNLKFFGILPTPSASQIAGRNLAYGAFKRSAYKRAHIVSNASLNLGGLLRLPPEAREKIEEGINSTQNVYQQVMAARQSEIEDMIRRQQEEKVESIDILKTFRFNVEDASFKPHKSRPNVYVGDQTGKMYILVPDYDGKPRPILIETADPQEMKKAMHQPIGSFGQLAKRTLKRFPGEFFRFNVAQAIIQSASCFGKNSTFLTGLSFKASHNNPVCVDNFITTLFDYKGLIGFYFFMLANDATSKALNNFTNRLLTLQNVKGQQWMMKNKPAILAGLRHPFGYIGMAAGSVASDFMHQLLSLDSGAACMEGLARGELISSTACKSMVSHFMSRERFWQDLTAGMPALIGSAAMATVTQTFLKKIGRGGYRVLSVPAGMTASAAKALLGKTFRSKEPLKFVVSGLSMVGGKVGYVVKVVGGPAASIFHMVLFFAWDFILRVPTTSYYWHVTDGKEWWGTGFEYDVKQLFGRTYELISGGFDSEGYELNCYEQPIVRPGPYPIQIGTEKKCDEPEGEEFPLTDALKKFGKHASRYRNRVLMPGVAEGAAGWKSKWAHYLKTFRIGKLILEYIYRERAEKYDTRLPTEYVADHIIAQWLKGLRIITDSSNVAEGAFDSRFKMLYDHNRVTVSGMSPEVVQEFVSLLEFKGIYNGLKKDRQNLVDEYYKKLAELLKERKLLAE